MQNIKKNYTNDWQYNFQKYKKCKKCHLNPQSASDENLIYNPKPEWCRLCLISFLSDVIPKTNNESIKKEFAFIRERKCKMCNTGYWHGTYENSEMCNGCIKSLEYTQIILESSNQKNISLKIYKCKRCEFNYPQRLDENLEYCPGCTQSLDDYCIKPMILEEPLVTNECKTCGKVHTIIMENSHATNCLNDPIKKEDSHTKQMKCKKCNVDMFQMIDDDSEFCDLCTKELESYCIEPIGSLLKTSKCVNCGEDFDQHSDANSKLCVFCDAMLFTKYNLVPNKKEKSNCNGDWPISNGNFAKKILKCSVCDANAYYQDCTYGRVVNFCDRCLNTYKLVKETVCQLCPKAAITSIDYASKSVALFVCLQCFKETQRIIEKYQKNSDNMNQKIIDKIYEERGLIDKIDNEPMKILFGNKMYFGNDKIPVMNKNCDKDIGAWNIINVIKNKKYKKDTFIGSRSWLFGSEGFPIVKSRDEEEIVIGMNCRFCNTFYNRIYDPKNKLCMSCSPSPNEKSIVKKDNDQTKYGRRCKICNNFYSNTCDLDTQISSLYKLCIGDDFYNDNWNLNSEMCNKCFHSAYKRDNIEPIKKDNKKENDEIEDDLAFIAKDKCKKCGNDYYNYPIRSEHGLCIDCVKSLEHMDWNNPIKKSFAFVIAKVEEDLDEKSTKPHCILCEEKAISTINLPCGHATMCNACSINYAKSFINKKESVLCCTCRQPITGNNVLFIQ
jgi:hypothetical protein